MAKVMPSIILGNDRVWKFLTSFDRTPCIRVDSTCDYFLEMDAEDSHETFKPTDHKGRRQFPQAFMQL